MKNNFNIIRRIHAVTGIIPFAWLLVFLSFLVIGTFQLGYIPTYGKAGDPNSLGLDWLSAIHTILFMLATLSSVTWLIITLVWLIEMRGKMSPNRLSVILFLFGVAGFFLFRYALTGYFEWVLD